MLYILNNLHQIINNIERVGYDWKRAQCNGLNLRCNQTQGAQNLFSNIASKHTQFHTHGIHKALLRRHTSNLKRRREIQYIYLFSTFIMHNINRKERQETRTHHLRALKGIKNVLLWHNTQRARWRDI